MVAVEWSACCAAVWPPKCSKAPMRQCYWRASARGECQLQPTSDLKLPSDKKELAMSTVRQAKPVAVPAEQEIRFWMRAPAVTININAPVSEAPALMREHDVRRLPVTLNTGELCGMITQGDIRGADILRMGGFDPVDI